MKRVKGNKLNRPTENQPLVTVNILSFNRINDLRNTLQKVYEQDYKNIEVIVVDNASTDGSPEMVEKEFPEVKLIRSGKNIGIAGWNKGFEAAKGEYVLVLDDDSYPENKTIEAGVNLILSDKKIAVVGFNVYNLSIKQSQTSTYTFDYIEFVGCGALLIKEVFVKVGGFDENIFIYAHERDYSVRILNAGYKIKYLKNAIVYHMPFLSNRKHPILNEFRIYNSTISYLIILRKYLRQHNFWKYQRIVSKLLINRVIILFYFYKPSIFFQILKYVLKEMNNVNTNSLQINELVLEKYDFFNVAIFDEFFFKRNIDTNKFTLVKNYLMTFFSKMETKINKISY